MSVSDISRKTSADVHRIRQKYEAEGNPFSSMNIFNISKGTAKSNWGGAVNGKSITGISKDLTKGTEQPIMVHIVNRAWCPQCHRHYESGAKVIRNVWRGKTNYCCPVDGAILLIQG